MKAYSLAFIIIIYCICRYTSVDLKPELKKNVLNFDYWINFKYEGMLTLSSNRFYEISKYILHTISDLKFSTINFDETCNYLQEKNWCSVEAKQYISDLIIYCRKIIPFIQYYWKQISSFNCTAHNILTNEISLILPKFSKVRKENRGIITSLISNFVGLAYEGNSSFLHNRRHKALHKAVKAMETTVDIQHNWLIHLEGYVVMYGVYNAETLEKLVKTVHQMHSTTTPNEKLFAGEWSTAFIWYVNKNGVHHYVINSHYI